MKKIFIAGHNGMVGSAILRKLQNNEELKILSVPRSKIDLTNQLDVLNLLLTTRPDEVILAAAKVGALRQITRNLQILFTKTCKYRITLFIHHTLQAFKNAISGFILHLSQDGNSANPESALLAGQLSKPMSRMLLQKSSV